MHLEPKITPVDARSTNRLVILGVAESDAHVVANHLIAYQLRAEGVSVINLGACTPVGEFIAAFQRHPNATAIIIGSLNGHAYEDLKDLRQAKRDLSIACPIIVGGNLGVTREQAAWTRHQLLTHGVDRVLEDSDDLLNTINSLPARNDCLAVAAG